MATNGGIGLGGIVAAKINDLRQLPSFQRSCNYPEVKYTPYFLVTKS